MTDRQPIQSTGAESRNELDLPRGIDGKGRTREPEHAGDAQKDCVESAKLPLWAVASVRGRWRGLALHGIDSIRKETISRSIRTVVEPV
jgi:hypothetical protein